MATIDSTCPLTEKYHSFKIANASACLKLQFFDRTKNRAVYKSLLFQFFLVFFGPLQCFCAAQPGASYCGPYTVSKPIILNKVNGTTISGLEIAGNNGICIHLTNCNNIKIEKCKLGPSSDCAIELYNCTNVTITDCRIKNVASGVYAIECHGINVNHIEVENVLGPLPRGQMVQFDKVTGTGNRVNDNICENNVGKSYAEDAISMFETYGTPTDPVQITGNWIRGGGPSKTGGGIMAGDSGGAYVLIKDNILVNPGQYGIGVASGTHIKIIHNKIYSKKQAFTGTGVYIWKQYLTRPCSEDTITENSTNWTNNEDKPDNYWNAGNCGTVGGWDTNIVDTAINESLLPVIIIDSCPPTANAAVINIKPVANSHLGQYRQAIGSAYAWVCIVVLLLLTYLGFEYGYPKWRDKKRFNLPA